MKRAKYFIYTVISASFFTGCVYAEQLPQEEPISLTMLTNGTGDYSFVEEIAEKYPQVDLELQCYPEEQYYTILKTRLATGDGPDFLFIQPGYAGSNGVENLAKAGYLLPVTEEASILKDTELWNHTLSSDEEIYGVSEQYMALGVHYNRTLFKQYNLSLPTCWEEFLSCCQTLKENGITPIAFSGQDPMLYQFGIYQIAANRLYAEDPFWDEKLRQGTASFTDPGTWDNILTLFSELYGKGYILWEKSLLTSSDETHETFQDGTAAMSFSIVGYGQENETDETGFFPLPANERGKQQYVSAAEFGGLAIYSETEHAELCKEILSQVIWKEVANAYEEKLWKNQEASYKDLPTFYFCNQGWPNEVEIVMERRLQEYLANPSLGIPSITQAMQAELEK